MMNAEEDIDTLPEDLLAMKLSSVDTFPPLHKSSDAPSSLGTEDSFFDHAKERSVINSSSDSRFSLTTKSTSSSSGTHTPVEFASDMSLKNTADLTGKSSASKFVEKSPASTTELFSNSSTYDDFLRGGNDKPKMSSFDLLTEKSSLNSSFGSLSNVSPYSEQYTKSLEQENTARMPSNKIETHRTPAIPNPSSNFQSTMHTPNSNHFSSHGLSSSSNNLQLTSPNTNGLYSATRNGDAVTGAALYSPNPLLATTTQLVTPTMIAHSNGSNSSFISQSVMSQVTSSTNQYGSDYTGSFLNNPNIQANISHDNQNNTNSELFIPNMYSCNAVKKESTPAFFVPAEPTESAYNYPSYVQPQNESMMSNMQSPSVFNSSTQQPNQLTSESYYNGQPQDYLSDGNIYQVQTGIDNQGRGIWQWFKRTVNKDWSAEQIRQQLKNATDTVLTTLDPQMEQYLKPVINVGVASQDTSVILGVKQGLSDQHGVAVIKSQPFTSRATPVLPIGFETAVNATNEALDFLTNVNFGFSGEYILVAVQIFLTELVAGQWSAMACVGIKDLQRNLNVYSFSQAIPLPLEVVTIAYNNTQQRDNWYGYDLAVEEAVRMFIPHSNDEDWCSVLTGIPLYKIVAMASQCALRDYKRQISKMQSSQQQFSLATYNNQYELQHDSITPQVQHPQHSQHHGSNDHQTSVIFSGF